jgi:hypothetical protein
MGSRVGVTGTRTSTWRGMRRQVPDIDSLSSCADVPVTAW